MSSHVALVLGAGANVGLSIAKKFTAQGWKVASVARTVKDEMKANSALSLEADFSDPESITKVFSEVESKLGTPNVVIYNAYFMTFSSGDDPFAAASAQDLAKSLAINVTSPYVAAKLAVEGFKKLQSSVPRVFIYTGNMSSSLIVPEGMSLGIGKNASLYFIETGAAAYGKDYQFYFADERMPNGGSVMGQINGDAHGEAYWVLANSKKQLPVNYTFVKGQGYVKFDIDRITEVKSMGPLLKDAEGY